MPSGPASEFDEFDVYGPSTSLLINIHFFRPSVLKLQVPIDSRFHFLPIPALAQRSQAGEVVNFDFHRLALGIELSQLPQEAEGFSNPSETGVRNVSPLQYGSALPEGSKKRFLETLLQEAA